MLTVTSTCTSQLLTHHSTWSCDVRSHTRRVVSNEPLITRGPLGKGEREVTAA